MDKPAPLKTGKFFRWKELAADLNIGERGLRHLLKDGKLSKLARGLYYVPRPSVYGPVPPEAEELVAAFLRDSNFLLVSPNNYNSLSLGTTQLYNITWVYNHKLQGTFVLGNRPFEFRKKQRFPQYLTQEFLLVDMLNNLDELAEDKSRILAITKRRLSLSGISKQMQDAVQNYGSYATRKLFASWAIK